MKKAEAHRRIEIDTPRVTPQDPCNCGREDDGETWMKPEPERLNDPVRNPDVAHPGGEGHPAIHKQIKPRYAAVLTAGGRALTPTRIGRAKQLVRDGKARVVRHTPFTIQLNYTTGEHVPAMTLGIDTGYGHVGFSVISEETHREYYRGRLELETNNVTKKRIDEKRMYRRLRRSRLWHRPARWMNRRTPEGWLPPSVSRLYNAQTGLVRWIGRWFPYTKLRFEIGKFDIQKIENPEINGTDYQNGDLKGYRNMKSYLLSREHGVCQLCGKPFTENDRIEVHHIIPRSKGGSNRASNLAVLHSECHKRLHNEGLEKQLKKSKQYKEPTFMNIVRKIFKEEFPEAEVTYGYLTAMGRHEYQIEKGHDNDAFVIAGGDNQMQRCEPVVLGQMRRNNRSLQTNNIKGLRGGRRIRRSRNPYHKGDLVWIDGEMTVCGGMTGGRVVIGWRKTAKGQNSAITVSGKKIEKVFYVRQYVVINK